MGEEMAEFMGLWIMSREFIDSEAGLAVLEASKENVKKNSPDLYERFLDAILQLGRRRPGEPLPPSPPSSCQSPHPRLSFVPTTIISSLQA